jgi:hypothetical protein
MSVTTVSTTTAARAATASLVLAVLALALSLTFFWFWGLPPAVPLAASVYYGVRARRLEPARSGKVTAAFVLDAIAAADTVVLLAVNWGHLY